MVRVQVEPPKNIMLEYIADRSERFKETSKRFHYIGLLMDLERKGFEKTSKYRDDDELAFLTSVKDRDFYEVRNELTEEIYQLSVPDYWETRGNLKLRNLDNEKTS